MDNDLISRSEAEKLGATCLARRNENGQLEAIISLDNAPTVEYPFYQEAYQSGYEEGKKIARPQGKWVIEHDWVHCFPCGHEQNYPSNFCPNCGAEMRKGDNNDT